MPTRTPLYLLTFVALCALAVPWESIAESPLVADRLSQNVLQQRAVPRLPRAAASEPAERSYTAFMDAFAERNDPRTVFEQLLTKLPTWYGLIVLLSAASILARQRPRPRTL